MTTARIRFKSEILYYLWCLAAAVPGFPVWGWRASLQFWCVLCSILASFLSLFFNF
ncbi:hypothetical protein ACS0TY_011580 [Phlomoides rotata]